MYAMALEAWDSATLTAVEIPTPEPKAKEIRVAVKAIGVNPVDWKMRKGGFLGLISRVVKAVRGPHGPIVLGVDFAGVIEAVGDDIKELTVGQRVVGGTDFSRGQNGSYADTVVVRADQVAVIPDNVSFEDAGALPVAGVTAWMAMTEYKRIGPGTRTLVLGASGGVGQLAVQIAKRTLHADLVAGVCSTKNVEFVTSLGADVVIDYSKGDPLALAKPHGPFDIIVDCAGGYSASACRAMLAPGGRHVMVAGDSPAAMVQIAVPPFHSKAILGKSTTERLAAIVGAVSAGEVNVRIEERYPLSDAEAALTKSQSGRMTGKIILVP